MSKNYLNSMKTILSMGEEIVEVRKNKILHYLKNKPTIFIGLLFAFIAWLGYYIRVQPLKFLIDVTTNDYVPSDPDAMGIFRYVQYLADHGQLMAVDYMRYFPFGYHHMEEFTTLTHLIVWFYDVYHFFFSSITLPYADVVYPAFAFVIALIFFFLLVRKVFDWKTALLASAFLTVLPAYLYRTLAGVSDKEAMAIIFFYAGIYFFLAFFLEKKSWKAWLYSILAGLAVGILWTLWGGIVFITSTVGLFVFILVLFDKLSLVHLKLYTLFLAVTLAVVGFIFPIRIAPSNVLTNPTSAILFLALALAWLHYFAYTKDFFKVRNFIEKTKIMPVLLSFLFLLFSAVVTLFFIYGMPFFTDRIANFYSLLISPFSANRWALTVAESHQPYFTDWVSQFSLRYLLLVFLGAVFTFYEIFKELGRKAYVLTIAFGLFLLAIVLNRYSSSAPLLNGVTPLSITLYLGSIVVFLGYMLYFFYQMYRKNKEKYHSLLSLDHYGYLFLLILFIFMLIGARSAIRLFFVLAPGTAIFSAAGIFLLVKYSKKIPTPSLRYGSWIVFAFFTFLLLNGFYVSVLAQASSAGSSYTPQWQYAMDWVRENTPEDAVFAHWWDYGYYVQTGGNRATLSDGGNADPVINYLTGRYLLTGQNDTEALQILASRNATNVIVVSDDIAKYGAFSAIGADANYDRYSWINIFSLDASQSIQTENLTTLVYTGGVVLDDGFTYQGIYFPAYSAGVAGIIVPMHLDGNNSFVGFEDPSAVVAYNGQYYTLPLQCLFFGDEEYTFFEDGEKEGLNACFQIIPTYNSNELNSLGAGLYLSHDVWHTWFAHHYLFGQDTEYFTTVYNDGDSVPLALYQGRLIGPFKIWEVHYPDNLTIPEEMYITELPEGVNTVLPGM